MGTAKGNRFGGKWTEEKISIFIKYVRAYLVIMNKNQGFRLLYFDGFAGSGIISPNSESAKEATDQQATLEFEGDNAEGETEASEANEYAQIQGVATQVLGIDDLRGFDIYYFVEKNQHNADRLDALLKSNFPNRETHVTVGDCNEKLLDMAKYLRAPENWNVRTMAFLDPYGMQLKWESLVALRGLNIDLWILVPTGIGVGRLLRNDGQINSSWMNRLKEFLGMEEAEIMAHFYHQENSGSLFGESVEFRKVPQATERVARLYCQRIKEAGLFEYVAEPRALKNSINSTMYHFVLCTNKTAALNIANTIK